MHHCYYVNKKIYEFRIALGELELCAYCAKLCNAVYCEPFPDE